MELAMEYARLKRRQRYDKINDANHRKRLHGSYLSSPSLLERALHHPRKDLSPTLIPAPCIDAADGENLGDDGEFRDDIIYDNPLIDEELEREELNHELLDIDQSLDDPSDTIPLNGMNLSSRTERPLHHYTNTSTLEYCENFTSLSRKAHLCKTHTDDILSFIKSGLPIPNNLPSTHKELVSLLNVDDLFTKRCICLSCVRSFEYQEKICSHCRSTDRTSIAYV